MSKYRDLVKGLADDNFDWDSRYKKPRIEPLIVGLSGIDPDEKLVSSEISHEALSGLLGGNILGHYHLTREQLSEVRTFQNRINSLASSLESFSNALSELITSYEEFTINQRAIEERQDNAINSLTSGHERLSADYHAFKEAQDNIEQRQDSLIENLNTSFLQVAVDFAEVLEAQNTFKREFSNVISSLSQTSQSLLERLNTVIGSVTEDMEILDARVDGDGVAHKNLGQAIRYIHQQTHEELRTLDFEVQQQIQSNAAANIENSLGLVKEIQDRKASIVQTENALREALQEAIIDEHSAEGVLSERINTNAEAIQAEQGARENDVKQLEAQTKADIQLAVDGETETNQELTRQINQNASGVSENTLLIVESTKRLKGRISEAVEQSEEELEQKIKKTSSELESQIAGVSEEITEQVNSNSEGILNNTLNIIDEAEKRRQGDELERKERVEDTAQVRSDIAQATADNEDDKETLEKQINDNAEASLQNTVNITKEAEQRRRDIAQEHAERIAEAEEIRDSVAQEAKSGYSVNQELQEQINANATANLENAANLAREAQRRWLEIADERMTRISDDELLKAEIKRTVNYEYINNRVLQEQTDANSEGIFQTLLNIVQEAQERRGLERELIQHGENIQNQLNLLWEAIAENVLTAEQASKMRQAIDALERSQRIEEDEGLQLQINSLAEAVHELLLQQGRTGKTIKTLDGKVDALEIAASVTGTNFASDEDFAGYMSDILGP